MGSFCKSCGEKDRVDEGHQERCHWGLKAVKKDGYLYGVAGQRAPGVKPTLVAQEKTRGAAVRAARLQMKALGPLYSLIEVRVVTVQGEVTDRFVKDDAMKWHHTDVRKRAAVALEEEAALPLPSQDRTGIQFQLGQ